MKDPKIYKVRYVVYEGDDQAEAHVIARTIGGAEDAVKNKYGYNASGDTRESFQINEILLVDAEPLVQEY